MCVRACVRACVHSPLRYYLHLYTLPEVKINIEEGVRFACGICRGMSYLHAMEPIIARFDLNPYHVFVSVDLL